MVAGRLLSRKAETAHLGSTRRCMLWLHDPAGGSVCTCCTEARYAPLPRTACRQVEGTSIACGQASRTSCIAWSLRCSHVFVSCGVQRVRISGHGPVAGRAAAGHFGGLGGADSRLSVLRSLPASAGVATFAKLSTQEGCGGPGEARKCRRCGGGE